MHITLANCSIKQGMNYYIATMRQLFVEPDNTL